MKRFAFLSLISLLLTACGTQSGHFKMEGRFMHLNQGELYVYSPDGIIKGFDTIKVEAGRFAYEIPCSKSGELTLIFPNFSEHPIFAESGGAVEVKADASHLKEMQVKGTDDNKLMTQFREMVAQSSPPEEQQRAKQFIEGHPSSAVSVYLLRKYYLRNASADCMEGAQLADLMMCEKNANGLLHSIKQWLQRRSLSMAGKSLPAFSATDISGQRVTDASLRSADMAVVVVCSAWSFQSLEVLRIVQSAINKKADIKALAISVDARLQDCQNQVRVNDLTFPIVCDGKMLDSPLLSKLGLSTVPAVLVLKKGKIVKRNIPASELRQMLDDYAR